MPKFFNNPLSIMNSSWLNSVLPIAAVFSFRMLGLFMLIPVFTIYATHLLGATPALIGIALGSYGLSQGILQIPFGMLSDRFGRKPIITIGLLLFALGSLVGALSHSIYMIIFARILQGTGAVGSVLIALLADLTPDEQRTKAMAVVGSSIGLSFMISMVISPAIVHQFGLAGIFYFTVGLACFGLILLHWVIPTPSKELFHADSETNPSLFKEVLTNVHLLRLDIGIFCQHFILTATFFVVPLLLQQQISLGKLTQSWHFYLPLLLISFVLMVPLIIWAEKKQHFKFIFVSAVLFTAISQLVLAFSYQHWVGICLTMLLYFIMFNVLEANLPSLVSKQASPEYKGTAMGIYSSSQFLGIFAGGTAAGFIFHTWSYQGIFITNFFIGLLWFYLTLYMKPNVYTINLLIPYNGANDPMLQDELLTLPGVLHTHFSSEEKLIYLRLRKDKYKTGSVEQIIASYIKTRTP